MSYQIDSYGNAYFPAGVSVASIPATTGTQNKVLVPGPNGRISSASIAQLITQSGGSLVSSIFGRTGDVTAKQGDYNTDQVTEGQALYFSDSRARKAISVTTFNTSGPATYDSTTGIINIPQYGSGIVGNYVPITRTITINGQTADLSANRIFTIDGMVYPSVGIPVSNGTAWGASIVDNSTNWNTAYSWGNHAGLYSLLGHTHTFASLTSIPTTLAGYGITDAATSAQGANADTAFGWGNHALVGYLTSFTETDPTVPSHVKAITTTNISNWDTAYTWGNHALAGYLTSFTETDPVWTSEKANYALKTYVDTSISNLIDSAPTTLDTLNELAAALGDDANFSTTVTNLIGTKEPAITAGTTSQYWRGDKTWQTLPIYTLSGLGGVPSTRTLTINGTSYDLSADRSWSITSMIYPSAGIAVSTGSAWGTSITDNSSNWNTAYSWGNHASAGYLTGITSTQVTNALGYTPYNSTNPSGYITGYTETDTLASVTARGASTSTRTTFTEVGATREGSDTVAVGPWFRWTNVAESRQMLTQLNASNGLTWWSYNGSVWASRMTLHQGGQLVLNNGVSNGSGEALIIGGSGDVKLSDGGSIFFGAYDYAASTYIRGYDDSNLMRFYINGTNSVTFTSSGISASAISVGSSAVWHAGNLTNLNQLSNGPGYITGYTETDTLASVVARGASSSSAITLGSLKVGPGAYPPDLSYQGLRHTSMGVSSNEYMIISANAHTYISTTTGNKVYIRPDANNSTYELVVGASASGLTFANNVVVHAGNVSSYAVTSLTDTLASVTGRGASTTAAITTGGLTVNTGGAGTWGKFVVNSTSLWGDGSSLYTTIGAGGGAGIMLYNPHVVWNSGNSCAGIRIGRSGGTSAGAYYEIGTGASDNFFIAKNALSSGAQFNINSSGNATFSGTVSASNLSGTNTGDQTNISGNAGTANTFSSSRSGYKGITDGAVAGQLMWKNYGNNHTLFDASAGTSPDGTSISRHTPTYPVATSDGNNSWGVNINLMGWNGSATYGVKVDWSRYSESSGNASTVSNGVYTNASMNTLSGVLNFGSAGATPYSNPTGTSNGISFGGIEASSLRQYGIFTEQENIGGNYSKLTFNYHTGIRLGASSSYGGTRFYNDAAGNGSSTMIFSVGNGDNHVRVSNNLIVSGTSSTTTLNAGGNVVVNSGNNLSSSSGGLTFWDGGGTTTSWVGFKNNTSTGWGFHGGATSTGGYSTYHIMDTTSRGWIWRFASVGGTNFAGTNVASIQNNNGAFSTGAQWDGTSSNPIFAQINVCQGVGGATLYRDIDMKGSWGAGEGHAITATYGNSVSNIVGQLVFQHDSPGSRIKLGRLYNGGNQSSYPWQLISDSNTGTSGAWVTLSGGDWSVTRYGPNTTWGAYLYVGAGSNKIGSGSAQVISTDGNLHLDCATNSKQMYLNYYAGGSAIGAYGPLNCTYDVTAYSSDKRLKTNIQPLKNALDKVLSLQGMTYNWNSVGSQYNWNPGTEREVGVFAQDVQVVLPEAVAPAPFDTDANGNSISGYNFLTVKYDKLTPLLIEAIKEQQAQIEELKNEIKELKNK